MSSVKIINRLYLPTLLLAILSSVLLSSTISATELYRITLLRAAPGNLEALIEDVKSYKAHNKGEASLMRHSQGDHWDLMMLEPAGAQPTAGNNFGKLADFQHSFLATSDTAWSEVKKKASNNNLYHIEMFKAVHGKAEALLKQRQMENQYLAATNQTTNIIFKTTFGSDVDSFTIGYHKDLATFASSPDLAKDVFEKAAVDAGFKNRADLSYYLRKLILSHHDTLAGRAD